MVTRTLRIKFWRDFLESKAIFFSISVILSLGIASYLALGITYQSLEYSRNHYYLRGNMADFLIHIKKAPYTLLPLLQRTKGIRQIETRLQFDIVVDLPDLAEPLGGRVISLPKGKNSIINKVFLREGSFFSENWEKEILVNLRFAKAHGLKVGDSIALILRNQKEIFRIQGLVITPEYIYIQSPGSIMPDFKRYGIFFMDHRALERYFRFQGSFNQIWGLFNQKSGKQEVRVLKKLEHLLDHYGVIHSALRKDFPSHGMIQNELNTLKIMATVLPFLFLVVSIMILYILLNRRIEQHRVEIGTLRALGFQKEEIHDYYFLFGLMIGILGVIGGILLGMVLAKGLLSVYKTYFTFPKMFYLFSPFLMVVSITLGLVFSILGIKQVAQKIAHLDPAEAMRPAKPPIGRRSFLEKHFFLWKYFSITSRFTFRSLFRSWKRNLLTLFAIGGASSILITSFYMYNSSYYFVDHQYHKVIHGDMALKFRNFMEDKGKYEILKMKEVYFGEFYFPLIVTFQKGRIQKKGTLLGLSSPAYLRTPRQESGRKILFPKEGLVLTKRMAENLHVRKGDILRFQPIEGKRKWISAPVKEIVREYVGLSVYCDERYLARLLGESFTFSQVLVKLFPGKEKAFLKKLKKIPYLSGFSMIKEEKRLLNSLLVENMLVMIFTALIFAGIIYIGAIYNHTVVTLGEKSKEIALFRVLGYTSKEISLQLFQENMILLFLGTLFGFPLGNLLSRIIVSELNTDLYRFPLVIYPQSYIWTLLLGLVFGMLSQLIVYFKVKHFPWMEEINLRE